MNPDKAIKILTINKELPDPYGDKDLRDAQELGIEALKREKANREEKFVVVGPLPGETED